jgi:hypothetical protein
MDRANLRGGKGSARSLCGVERFMKEPGKVNATLRSRASGRQPLSVGSSAPASLPRRLRLLTQERYRSAERVEEFDCSIIIESYAAGGISPSRQSVDSHSVVPRRP